MSRKRVRSTTPPPGDESQTEIYRSQPISDRSSTFLGFFSPTLAPKAIAGLTILEDASHCMWATRKPSKQRTLSMHASQAKSNSEIHELDSDDDGEKYGGKRCEKVLEAMNVDGTLLVARWYGGVMLGPVRFAHIETCARDAVQAWHASSVDAAKRPIKQSEMILTEAESEALKQRLQRYLVERDASIEVLRGLLAEKTPTQSRKLAAGNQTAMAATLGDANGPTSKSEGSERVPKAIDDIQRTIDKPELPRPSTIGGSPRIQTAPSPKTINYSGLPLETLRRLEKARDATIGFILKQIDKAESLSTGAA